MLGITASNAVVAIQIGYCVSDIISKCGVGLVIYQVTTPSRTRMGPCFLGRLSGGAGVCNARLSGPRWRFCLRLICGLPLMGLSTISNRPRGNFLAASAAIRGGHHAEEL